MGNVTRQKVTHGSAPRSWAASSRWRSNPARRARTVTATYAMLNITCAMTIVTIPLGTPNVMNSASSDAPMTISGAAMFANRTPSVSPLPRKR
jgi:hypothetical protein